MASKYLRKYPVPEGFNEILHDFTREILRAQPEDIIEFGMLYFECLQEEREFVFDEEKKKSKFLKKESMGGYAQDLASSYTQNLYESALNQMVEEEEEKKDNFKKDEEEVVLDGPLEEYEKVALLIQQKWNEKKKKPLFKKKKPAEKKKEVVVKKKLSKEEELVKSIENLEIEEIRKEEEKREINIEEEEKVVIVENNENREKIQENNEDNHVEKVEKFEENIEKIEKFEENIEKVEKFEENYEKYEENIVKVEENNNENIENIEENNKIVEENISENHEEKNVYLNEKEEDFVRKIEEEELQQKNEEDLFKDSEIEQEEEGIKKGEICLEIISGENLINDDETIHSYCVAFIGNDPSKIVKSRIIENDFNPVWDCSTRFFLKLKEEDMFDINLVVQVFDYFNNKKKIGEIFIDLFDCIENHGKIYENSYEIKNEDKITGNVKLKFKWTFDNEKYNSQEDEKKNDEEENLS